MSTFLFQTISERAFDGLNDLKRLDLENNRLRTLERGVFATIPTLTHLNLMRNSLETLTLLTIQPLMNNLVNHTSSMLMIKGNLDFPRFIIQFSSFQCDDVDVSCLSHHHHHHILNLLKPVFLVSHVFTSFLFFYCVCFLPFFFLKTENLHSTHLNYSVLIWNSFMKMTCLPFFVN